jgi:hypothetical protein
VKTFILHTMIASFSRNFLFVRTRKTASTSTEIVLGSWCGGDDIVTPVGVDDELIRHSYGGGPANFCEDPRLEEKYKAALATKDAKLIARIYRDVMKQLRFHHHMDAAEIQAKLPREFWQGARKFAVDRHPYEKAVSIAYWRNRKAIANGASVEDFLASVVEKADYRNFDLYSIDRTVWVDRVIRYEDLWSEIGALATSLGVAMPTDLPAAKAQYRKDRRPARDILPQPQKSRIYDICHDEFALLGYER